METREASGPGPNVAVIGTTGSGKTTCGRSLAAVLGVRHIELDALFWGPNWTPVGDEIFRARIREATATPGWVSDGNYVGSTDGMLWDAANTLVWLDYTIVRIYSQLFVRTTTRAMRGVELWSGNKESLRTGFMSRDSLFVWAVKSHWRHRREWPERLLQPRYQHLKLVRLRSPAATKAYLAGIRSAVAREVDSIC